MMKARSSSVLPDFSRGQEALTLVLAALDILTVPVLVARVKHWAVMTPYMLMIVLACVLLSWLSFNLSR